MAATQQKPKSFGVLLFPDFEVLDIAGPIEALNCLNRLHGNEDMIFSYIAKTKDPLVPGPGLSHKFRGQQLYLPTHTFDDAPQLDVLIVPGGTGQMHLPLQQEKDFIRKTYSGYDGHKPLHTLLSVCNGSGLLAQSGVLDGHRATGNKDFWQVNTQAGPKTFWVAKARWVQSGNIWTTSGVSAGIDGMLAWIGREFGEDVVEQVVGTMEFRRVAEESDDPFAARFGCHDVPPSKT